MSDFSDLIDLTKARMEELGIPGVAIGITHGGQDHTVGLGVTSIENPLEVTPDTIFQIGSTTKTYTGTVLALLEEQGALKLDDKVRYHIPEFILQDESVASAITVRQLLNHSGGWAGDLFVNTGDGDDALTKYVIRVAEQDQLTPLGETFHYNNSAFGVAGRVVEVVTGKSFEDACTDLILKPLKADKSSFFPWEAMVDRFAAGHYTDAEGNVKVGRPWAFARAVAPIGRINSTVVDQLAYAKAQMTPGVFSAELLEKMQTPDFPAANGEKMGLSWFTAETTAGRLVRHGGATNGHMSSFWMVPSQKFACTILTNHEKGGTLNLELTKWIKERFLNIIAPEMETIRLGESDLADYTATYLGPAFGAKIEMTAHDGGLVRQYVPGDVSDITVTPPPPPPAAWCRFIGPDLAEIDEGEGKGVRIEFLRGSSGKVVWMRSGGRIFRKL